MNNRAFIKRDNDTTLHLQTLEMSQKVVLNPENYFDEPYWYYESDEPFHCYNNGKTVLFQDARLPKFELELKYVELKF